LPIEIAYLEQLLVSGLIDCKQLFLYFSNILKETWNIEILKILDIIWKVQNSKEKYSINICDENNFDLFFLQNLTVEDLRNEEATFDSEKEFIIDNVNRIKKGTTPNEMVNNIILTYKKLGFIPERAFHFLMNWLIFHTKNLRVAYNFWKEIINDFSLTWFNFYFWKKLIDNFKVFQWENRPESWRILKLKEDALFYSLWMSDWDKIVKLSSKRKLNIRTFYNFTYTEILKGKINEE